MHEMGIALEVLEATRKEAYRFATENAAVVRIARIGLRIGEFAGVDPESLRFCFAAITKGTELEPVQLEIEWRSGTRELDFVSLEMEDQEVCV